MTDVSPPVAGSPTPSDAPDPDAVRDALRALATGTAGATPATFRETVADAAAATDRAVDAAAFLRAGRLSELARAVADARAAGATPTAETGERALSTLRRFEAAVRNESGGGAPESDGPDHFRPGRDIVLPETGQPTDR